MANHKSAIKRVKTNEKRRVRNKMFLSKVKTAVKQLEEEIFEGDKVEEINKLFTKAQSLLSKSVAKGILHKNNASRKISRLSSAIKKIQPKEEAGDKTTTKQKASKKKTVRKKKTTSSKKKTKTSSSKKTSKKKKS